MACGFGSRLLCKGCSAGAAGVESFMSFESHDCNLEARASPVWTQFATLQDVSELSSLPSGHERV